jgi:oligopeptidase B
VPTDPKPPLAPRRPVTTTHFGDERVDDYSWLRDRDDEAVLAYLSAENDFAAHVLARTAPLEQRVYDEIVARIVETDVSAPVRWGPWWYYERTSEGSSYPVHCRRRVEGDSVPDLTDPSGEQVVLDENAIALGHEFLSVGVLEPSPDHRIAAVGVDFEGDERHAVTFLALDGGPAPTETLVGVGYSVAWTKDAAALLYTRVDAAWRPNELWRHVLGTDPADDELVLREDDERFRISISLSRDGAVHLVHLNSTQTTEVLASDASPASVLSVVWPRRQGVECSVEHVVAPDGSRWWLAVTNDDGARDFKLAASPAAGAPAFREVLAEQPGRRIDGIAAFASHLAISRRVEGVAAVRIVPLDGGPDPFGADLAERGFDVEVDEEPSTTVLGANLEYDARTVRIAQTSLVTPTGELDVDVTDGTRHLVKRMPIKGGYDADRFVSARLWLPARDGTLIPVSIVHRRDLLGASAAPGDAPSVRAPMLLYGYGAYEICIDPTFSTSRLSLLERGVIFAIAHVRGGGELGRAWYEAGRLEHKATTFTDFVDVAHGLCEGGFTEPRRLAAMGGSAGGLLMGAAVNLEPSAFRAVVAEVPFVDVLNTILDPSLPLTVSEWEEWGDPLHDRDAYFRLKSWSPYDNVEGTEPDGATRTYPELLVLGSLNDTRVSYWEPAKWVAKLRASNPDNEVALKTDLGAGHAGPSGRYDAWRERALIYAFVLDRLGADDTTSTG